MVLCSGTLHVLRDLCAQKTINLFPRASTNANPTVVGNWQSRATRRDVRIALSRRRRILNKLYSIVFFYIIACAFPSLIQLRVVRVCVCVFVFSNSIYWRICFSCLAYAKIYSTWKKKDIRATKSPVLARRRASSVAATNLSADYRFIKVTADQIPVNRKGMVTMMAANNEEVFAVDGGSSG